MPPEAEALRSGVAAALGVYAGEADLSMAVGESGRIFANVEIHLERGRVRWTKGAVYFERRIEIGARDGR